ncbi:MAG: hypothetical protein AAFN12_07280 [Cyanobacteria bacterium J06560_2]
MPVVTKPANQVSQRAPESNHAGNNDNRTGSKVSDSKANNDKVCWIEVKRYPYQPDHQVELLHLQAEADALLIKLQTAAGKS